MKTRTCPICKREYNQHPALSRRGNYYVCPDCGVKEALEDWSKPTKKEDKHE
jgi:ssDNA-binding Zn-finger/Zn-ribbon topoisomerase 1